MVPILLLCSAASGFYSRTWAVEVQKREATLTSHLSRVVLLEELRRRVRAADPVKDHDSYEGLALEANVAQVLRQFLELRQETGVSFEQVLAVPQKEHRVEDGATAPSRRVGVPLLRRKSVKLQGRYASYLGLRRFFEASRSLPIAVTSISARGRALQIGVDVYGL